VFDDGAAFAVVEVGGSYVADAGVVVDVVDQSGGALDVGC